MTYASPGDLDHRVPGTHLPEIMSATRIQWPTHDLDVVGREEHAVFLERIRDAIETLPTQPSQPPDVTVPTRLSPTDAAILRPVLEKLRTASPGIFDFFAPPEPDAAGAGGV